MDEKELELFREDGCLTDEGLQALRDGQLDELGRLEAALIMEAMSYGCAATSAYVSIHNMAAWMIDTYGGAELKARYLPALVSMDKIASYCLTEPGSGSDAAALKTTARLDGDH